MEEAGAFTVLGKGERAVQGRHVRRNRCESARVCVLVCVRVRAYTRAQSSSVACERLRPFNCSARIAVSQDLLHAFGNGIPMILVRSPLPLTNT